MPFFKTDDNTLLETSNIEGPGFSLSEAGKDLNTYPVEGWYWFDTEAAARSAFGLPAIVQDSS